jgi:hypothetical protein
MRLAAGSQAVEKVIFNRLLPLSRLPQRGRRLRRQPTFTQGVEGKVDAKLELDAFLNTLLERLAEQPSVAVRRGSRR